MATTLRQLADAATARLKEAGVPEPRLDARLLIRHALGLRREAFVTEPERPVSAPEEGAVAVLVDRRAAREPVSRILGEREFWSLTFRLAPATLDPRPDSEALVEAVLARIDRRGAPRLLDLGTGSGCLLLALLHELPGAWGLGVDLAPEAARTAAGNARDLGLADRAAFAVGRWSDAVAGKFDIVVSNPPYIPDPIIPTLEPEVRTFDPQLALAGGQDGLDAYRDLAPRLLLSLKKGGLAALEVGYDQAGAVARLLDAHGMIDIETVRDMAGVERVVLGRRPRN